jgi:hypothetical protein
MKHALLVIILQLASTGGDAYFTNRNMSMGAREMNPTMRPFVGTQTSRIVTFSAIAAFKIALPIELRHHGHYKIAKTAEILGIVDSAQGAAVSAHNGRY